MYLMWVAYVIWLTLLSNLACKHFQLIYTCYLLDMYILQDLVKNLARIRQDFFNVSYISCKILARILQGHSCKILLRWFLQDLVRFLQESFKILQEYSDKIFLSG